MKKFNNKSGFTLIEIIVVLIIVGILAAIALPNLFSNVEKSHAAEGLSTLSAIRTQVEGCVQAHTTAAAEDCGTLALVGVGTTATTNFTYNYSGPGGAPTDAMGATGMTYSLIAVYQGNSVDTVTMTRNTDSSVTCTGAAGTTFSGVC